MLSTTTVKLVRKLITLEMARGGADLKGVFIAWTRLQRLTSSCSFVLLLLELSYDIPRSLLILEPYGSLILFSMLAYLS